MNHEKKLSDQREQAQQKLQVAREAWMAQKDSMEQAFLASSQRYDELNRRCGTTPLLLLLFFSSSFLT